MNPTFFLNKAIMIIAIFLFQKIQKMEISHLLKETSATLKISTLYSFIIKIKAKFTNVLLDFKASPQIKNNNLAVNIFSLIKDEA